MNRDKILKIFPAFQEISDKTLRERAISAMLMAMEQGNWNESNLNTAPTSIRWSGYHVPWAEHVTDVVNICIASYEVLSKYFARNRVEFDRDVLICGALLHDIGKLTEYTEKDGKAVFSANSNLMRHPLSGAIIAAKAGLPDRIVHLIATHSFEGDRSYQTPESWFVRTVDTFAYDCSKTGLKKIL